MIPVEDPPCGVWILGAVLVVCIGRFVYLWLYCYDEE